MTGFLRVHAEEEVNILDGDQRDDMATGNVSDRVRELAQHLGIDESEVNQRAVETGVETLYRDMVITQYLACELSEREAKRVLRALKQETNLYLSSPLVEHAIWLVESDEAGW